MRPKLHAIHLPRDAYVDSRQSTGHQGRAHPESPRRHSALAEHARGLGVPHVRVLAEAVGRSGTGRHARPGWGPRLAAVCAGRVSAVFACEASRWARTNRAWHHLIALGALTETWRIDDDGSAAPRQLHERGVRGLQGAMAAYARGCMRQRARQAFAANMPRGHGLGAGPVGCVRTREARLAKRADRQGQHAVAGVCQQLRALGRARQTRRWAREAPLPLPAVRPGTWGRAILWRWPSEPRSHQRLRNPCSAGARV